LGQRQPPIPAKHRTLIAPGKRCRRIAGAHILAADADRPVINAAGGIREFSRERRSVHPAARANSSKKAMS
jgi:hypothetical protein